LYIIGTDEAGRGPLAGPVATAAACFRFSPGAASPLFQFLGDSKALSADARESAIRKLIPNGTAAFFKYAEDEHIDTFVSTATREQITDELFIGGAVRFMSAASIDERNILEASLDGMCMCAAALMRELNAKAEVLGIPCLSKENTIVLIDGPHTPFGLMGPAQREKKIASMVKGLERKAKLNAQKMHPEGPKVKGKGSPRIAVALPSYDRGDTACLDGVKATGVVKGDALCPSIAAASILAKVARDHFLEATMHPAFPQYNFAAHKGYPTQAHMELLAKHGACPFHRRSFGPVQKALGVPQEAVEIS
jgi:ribonuclease HII